MMGMKSYTTIMTIITSESTFQNARIFIMKLLEPMPHAVTEKIQGILLPEEEELIRVSTDVNRDGSFGTQWVIVTDKRVIVVPTEGVDGVVDASITELEVVRTEPLTGGGRWRLSRRGMRPSLSHTPVHSQKNSLRWHAGLSNSARGTNFLLTRSLTESGAKNVAGCCRRRTASARLASGG